MSNKLHWTLSTGWLCVVLSFSVLAQTSATGLLGDWVLNETRSAEVQPEQLESRNWLGGGKINTSVSVGGIPLPRSGGNQGGEFSDLAPIDPDILRCKRLQIAEVEQDLTITYETLGSERFRQGDYRGMTSRWTNKRLRSRYQTTTRKVTHELALQKDDSLLVTVTIKAKGSRKRTYKQVFERPGKITTNAKDSAQKAGTDAET